MAETSDGGPDRAVGVVGDSAHSGTASLRRYATLIEDLAGIRTHVLVLGQDETEPHAHLDDVGVLFVPRASAEFACRVRALAGGLPVLTGQDTTAIALTSALLTALTRAGRAPRASQVVIAGADALPILCPLLMVCGVGSVTTWNPSDAEAFPLRRVTAGVDIVIDLLSGGTTTGGTTTGGVAGMGAFAPPIELTVIGPEHARDPLLALPGLLRAMTRSPDARLDVDVHHACALALVMATPPDELRPHGPDRVLADRVADAATTALRESANRPFDSAG